LRFALTEDHPMDDLSRNIWFKVFRAPSIGWSSQGHRKLAGQPSSAPTKGHPDWPVVYVWINFFFGFFPVQFLLSSFYLWHTSTFLISQKFQCTPNKKDITGFDDPTGRMYLQLFQTCFFNLPCFFFTELGLSQLN
jgi:hypothetical protein